MWRAAKVNHHLRTTRSRNVDQIRRTDGWKPRTVAEERRCAGGDFRGGRGTKEHGTEQGASCRQMAVVLAIDYREKPRKALDASTPLHNGQGEWGGNLPKLGVKRLDHRSKAPAGFVEQVVTPDHRLGESRLQIVQIDRNDRSVDIVSNRCCDTTTRQTRHKARATIHSNRIARMPTRAPPPPPTRPQMRHA